MPVSVQASTTAYRHNKKYGDTVPCCKECNSVLGNKLFETVQGRAKYIATSLKTRYKKVLSAPVWTADEMAEIGPDLRSSIMFSAVLRREVHSRIKHAEDGELVLAMAAKHLLD